LPRSALRPTTMPDPPKEQSLSSANPALYPPEKGRYRLPGYIAAGIEAHPIVNLKLPSDRNCIGLAVISLHIKFPRVKGQADRIVLLLATGLHHPIAANRIIPFASKSRARKSHKPKRIVSFALQSRPHRKSCLPSTQPLYSGQTVGSRQQT
jgi:hypothetical protein